MKRHFHEIRIAKENRAVGIGALHRLDQVVQRLRVAPDLAEIVALQNVEHLDQADAAGGGRRHGDDVVAAVCAAYHPALDGLVGGEIPRGHDAAGLLHSFGDLPRDAAAVESPWPACGDGAQCFGEITLDEPVAFIERFAVLEEDRGRGRPARQPLCSPRHRVGDTAFDGEAFTRQRNSRFDQLGKRELAGAVFPLRQRQARHGAGHADRQSGIA